MESLPKIDVSKSKKIILLFLFILLFFVWLYFMYSKAYRDIGCDFQYYSVASSAFLSGNNPYQTGTTFPFVYPLFFCVLISPIVILPYWLQHLVWYIFSFLSLFAIMFILIRYYYKVISDKEILILIIPFLLLFRVIHNNLSNGQVTIIVLLLCTLFLYYYLRSHRFTAALFLSAAISIKLTPLILLIYILFRRDLLTIGLVILFSIVLSFLIPYLIAGSKVFEYYSFYFNTFFNENVITKVHFSPTEYAFGFSLVSVIRYLIPSISKFLGMIITGVLTVTPIVYVQLKNDNNIPEADTDIFPLYDNNVIDITIR